jgi:hypothetical protein
MGEDCYNIKEEYVGNLLKRHSAEHSSAYLGRAKYTSKQTPRFKLWNRLILKNSFEAELVTMLKENFVGWHLCYSHSSKVTIYDAAWGSLPMAGCGSLWMNHRKGTMQTDMSLRVPQQWTTGASPDSCLDSYFIFLFESNLLRFYMERRPHTIGASKCIQSSSVMHNTVYYKGE